MGLAGVAAAAFSCFNIISGTAAVADAAFTRLDSACLAGDFSPAVSGTVLGRILAGSPLTGSAADSSLIGLTSICLLGSFSLVATGTILGTVLAAGPLTGPAADSSLIGLTSTCLLGSFSLVATGMVLGKILTGSPVAGVAADASLARPGAAFSAGRLSLAPASGVSGDPVTGRPIEGAFAAADDSGLTCNGLTGEMPPALADNVGREILIAGWYTGAVGACGWVCAVVCGAPEAGMAITPSWGSHHLPDARISISASLAAADRGVSPI
jgi:hypothetical protein